MKLYRTRTQEQYDWLMQKLEDEGYEWWGNSGKPTEKDFWLECQDETLIRAGSGSKELKLTRPALNDVEESEIIEVSDLMDTKFKVGDKVRVVSDAPGIGVNTAGQVREVVEVAGSDEDNLHYKLSNGFFWYSEEHIEPLIDRDTLMQKVMERNNKPEQEDINDKVNRPTHYKNGNKDLFDELYERLYHDERLYNGREVFIIVMKFVAERYIRRYPNKNEEDLQKGIYTLERLKEYEELEETE